ncbi:hypothetical protein DFJ74DRAFT_433583 [Hyaloraphidium curvatum]|nr:hypothetical protein DFJ74DRAFT_433583 [Hyaloraphidium curvatum]
MMRRQHQSGRYVYESPSEELPDMCGKMLACFGFILRTPSPGHGANLVFLIGRIACRFLRRCRARPLIFVFFRPPGHSPRAFFPTALFGRPDRPGVWDRIAWDSRWVDSAGLDACTGQRRSITARHGLGLVRTSEAIRPAFCAGKLWARLGWDRAEWSPGGVDSSAAAPAHPPLPPRPVFPQEQDSDRRARRKQRNAPPAPRHATVSAPRPPPLPPPRAALRPPRPWRRGRGRRHAPARPHVRRGSPPQIRQQARLALPPLRPRRGPLRRADRLGGQVLPAPHLGHAGGLPAREEGGHPGDAGGVGQRLRAAGEPDDDQQRGSDGPGSPRPPGRGLADGGCRAQEVTDPMVLKSNDGGGAYLSVRCFEVFIKNCGGEGGSCIETFAVPDMEWWLEVRAYCYDKVLGKTCSKRD